MEQLEALARLLRACAKMLRRIAMREPAEAAPSELFSIAAALDDTARMLEDVQTKRHLKSKAGVGGR